MLTLERLIQPSMLSGGVELELTTKLEFLRVALPTDRFRKEPMRDDSLDHSSKADHPCNIQASRLNINEAAHVYDEVTTQSNIGLNDSSDVGTHDE